MRQKNRYGLVGYSLPLILALNGCGGGSSTPSNDDTTAEVMSKSTYTVSGTVPGTLIEAFCRDGGYFSIHSTDNGTEEHPFTITLPAQVNCKFIMTTNEQESDPTQHIITPILMSNGTETTSYFKLSEEDIDLGYIPLSTTGEGIQQPLVLDVSNQKVELNSFTYDALDTDQDNIPNVYEDDDNDSILNQFDNDDDNDGIIDSQDSDYADDRDGDGVANAYDTIDNTAGTTTNTTTGTAIALPTTYNADAGRLLASQCAQCHGTKGVSVTQWDSIAGESDLLDEIYEDDAPIMMAQAHGYTTSEIELIGNWLKNISQNENLEISEESETQESYENTVDNQSEDDEENENDESEENEDDDETEEESENNDD